jgi:cardiolipin synthase
MQGGQATSIFDRHLAREAAIVDSPLTIGNQVRLLQDGPATYEAMLAAILAARDHINMETYILDDDDVGRRFAEALIAKQRQGVQVNLIHDSVGTVGTPKEFFQRLADSGIRILEFNPMNPLMARKEWELNQRDHRKLLIVDGRIAFLGGINISSVYSGGSSSQGMRPRPAGSPAWRDTDLQLEGPVVAELQKMFLATWVAQKGEPLTAENYFPKPVSTGRQVVRAIGSSPDEPYSLIYATLLSAIASAETSVHLTNAYFAPDPQLLATLEAAAARGVDVTLILPSNTDSWLVFHAGRGYYEQLRQDPRAARRDPAFEDGIDRRSVGHRRVDQSRLAKLPAQPRVERSGARRGIRPPGAGDVRQGSRGIRCHHARALAESSDQPAPEGAVGPRLGVLALIAPRAGGLARNGT